MKRLYHTAGFWLTVFISGGIAFWLAVTTRYITYWPTDSETLYIPVARSLLHLPYLSDLYTIPDPHNLGQIVLHGKEALILGVAIFQNLLHDYSSLYPNILLLICVNAISSILVYIIFNIAFDKLTAWLIYLLFTTCYWPYMYILQGAHQPLVLMFFLLTIFLLLKSSRYHRFVFHAGLSFGFMLFSSPTAFFYFPYFILLAIMKMEDNHPLQIRTVIQSTLLFTTGVIIIVLLFTYPDPIGKMQQFFRFLNHSQFDNHFVRFHALIKNWLPFPYSISNYPPLTFRGGGWYWLLKYCLTFLPVLFLLYGIGHIIILQTSKTRIRDIIILVLCLTTPLIVESARLAQFARNYFSWLPGILFVIAWAYQRLSALIMTKDSRVLKNGAIIILSIVLTAHAVFNIHSFLTDILPTRMANTKLVAWLRAHDVKTINAPENHFALMNTIDQLNGTSLGHIVDIDFVPTILSSQQNYYVLPPLTGKSVWHNCLYEDFFEDPNVYQLAYITRDLQQFVIASFPTMSSSRFWPQEEEICAYRDLVLGQIKKEDRQKGFLYVIDVKKLQRAWPSLL